jgi:hypothetical protein
MRVFQMLEEKAPAPEYGTYQYSALADSMGIGMHSAAACLQRPGSCAQADRRRVPTLSPCAPRLAGL